MIAIEEEKDLLNVNVYAEFTLADYKEFEQAVIRELNMSKFTVDVAWEDIKFTRAHAHDFARIAVVTDDQWVSWSSWLGTAFTDADVEFFKDAATASGWIHTG
jgi:hypothetical protein